MSLHTYFEKFLSPPNTEVVKLKTNLFPHFVLSKDISNCSLKCQVNLRECDHVNWNNCSQKQRQLSPGIGLILHEWVISAVIFKTLRQAFVPLRLSSQMPEWRLLGHFPGVSQVINSGKSRNFDYFCDWERIKGNRSVLLRIKRPSQHRQQRQK